MQRRAISSTLRKFLYLPFIMVLLTVFAESQQLAYGVVSAKYFWFYASMFLLIPAIPFLKPIKHINAADFFILLVSVSMLFISIISGTPFLKTKLIILLLLLVLYFQLRNFLEMFRSAEMLFTFVLVVTALAECLIGLSQLYGYSPSNHGLFRITGTFFNPGPYSGYIGMLFPMALYNALLFLKTENRLRKLMLWQSKKATNNMDAVLAPKGVAKRISVNYWFQNVGAFFNTFFSKPTVWTAYLFGVISLMTVLASLLALPAAMSRASWIGLAAGSIWVLYCYEPIRRATCSCFKSKTRRVWVVITVFFLLGGVGIGLYALRPASVDGRLMLWKNVLKTMVEHPLGVGLGKFGSAVGETQATYFASEKVTQSEIDRADVPFYAFNEYLQIGVESGVLTLALFLGMLILTLRKAYRKSRHGVFGALVSLSFFACFSYPFSVLPFLVVFIFLLAMCNMDGQKQESDSLSIVSTTRLMSLPTNWNTTPVTYLSMVIIACCLADRLPTYRAWQEWNSCKMLLGVELYKDASDELKPLYVSLNDNTDFLFDYSRALSAAGCYQESNRILSYSMHINSDPMLYNVYGKNCQALKNYEGAEKAFSKAYNIVPNRIYPLYLLSKFYAQTGKLDKARNIAKDVFNHKVIVPSRAIEEMKDSLRLMLILPVYKKH